MAQHIAQMLLLDPCSKHFHFRTNDQDGSVAKRRDFEGVLLFRAGPGPEIR
jgi:hypothetical protein